MKTIKISELKKNCYAIIRKVEKSQQPIFVSKRGKTIAKISPSATNNHELWVGCLSSTGKIVGDIVAPTQNGDEWEVLKS
jgi:prevent-host-death family protein